MNISVVNRKGHVIVAMKQWFTVHTKSRQENLASDHLSRQGYEVYYPRIRQDQRRRGRWNRVIEPLFPRYLFVRLAAGIDNFAPIRSTVGVSDLVRVGRMPRPVPEDLISVLKQREDQEQGIHISSPQWKNGMSVEFIEGPFAGIRGVFKASCSHERVIILMSLLGQNNAIVVARDAVIPV